MLLTRNKTTIMYQSKKQINETLKEQTGSVEIESMIKVQFELWVKESSL